MMEPEILEGREMHQTGKEGMVAVPVMVAVGEQKEMQAKMVVQVLLVEAAEVMEETAVDRDQVQIVEV